jgi:hypothetical protein
VSTDVWASPGTRPTDSWGPPPLPKPASQHSLRQDLATAAAVVVGLVLLAAPVGLVWSALAPHYTVVFKDGEATYPNIESTKAFIGADGSFVAVALVAGLLTGAAAWWLARRSGPWTVVALAVGGLLAAWIASRVGVLPGQEESFQALDAKSGSVELFLGSRDGESTHLRSGWAIVAWPAAALLAFAVPGYVRPEELD